jgi:serine/threonine protein phosphatase 1
MMPKLYAVGDVHGMVGLLRQALTFIGQDAGEDLAHVVFLGDFVDRGPDSKDVLDTLMGGPQNPRHTWTPLKGNHDHLFERALSGDSIAQKTWFLNGAEPAIRSFGLQLEQWRRIPPRYVDFVRDLPLVHEDARRLFVHAGLRPGIPIHDQDPNDLLWIRGPFLQADRPRFR